MSMLEIAMVITALIKLSGAGYLIRVYRKTRRKSSLMFATALVMYSLHTFSDLLGNYFLNQISIALTSALIFSSIYYLRSEEESLASRSVHILMSFTPIIVTLYTWLLYKIKIDFELWGITAVNWGVSGFFILLSGILALELRKTFSKDILWLALPLIAIGAHEMDYPFLRPVQWFTPIGFLLAAALVVLLVYGIVVVFGSEVYFKEEHAKRPIQLNLSPGSVVMTTQEFNKVMPSLKEFPTLAFVRNLKPPENWYSYFITRIQEDENTLNPTNLPRMLELSRKYLQSVKNGIVVIDSLEYLSLYNGFENTLKYLALIRDYALINGGTLIIVTDRKIWNEREWAQLMSLFS
ncbi:DUF835 domain-containing protein [Pyrococcus woesei]|uniref:DUF835 domain-containing protein n=1 Tax=Pyrococcus woesei TaxID=2262 RepID=UPI003D2EFD1D